MKDMVTIIEAKRLPKKWPENRTYIQEVQLSDETMGTLKITIIPRGLNEQPPLYKVDFLADNSMHYNVHDPYPELTNGMKLNAYDKNEVYILKLHR